MTLHPADTRSALLEAAIHCFAEHGFEGASIRMVAARAGRPVSLISHHFGGKEGLYREVFATLFQDKPLPVGQGVPARTREEAIRNLREQVRSLYGAACHNAEPAGPLKEAGRRLWLMELRQPRPEILELLKLHLGPWAERMKANLRLIRPDLPEEAVAYLGSTILGQITGHSLTRGVGDAIWSAPPLAEDRCLELATDFVLRGLGAS